MFAIITENDESQWDDITGVKYHFPNRYKDILKTGTKVIYYKGKLQDKSFKSERLSNKPHYFGVAVIGKVEKEKDTTNYYASINQFSRFIIAVPSKINDKYIEQIPATRRTNYFRTGVREITKNIYERILGWANLNELEESLNDQKADCFTTVIKDGKSIRIYTTKYERKKGNRDKAITYHGYACKVCGFDFKEIYGPFGEGYIHVHHLRPLSSIKKEVIINPEKDLTVVCANCHSMIHRRKNVLLTIEKLKKLIKRKYYYPK